MVQIGSSWVVSISTTPATRPLHSVRAGPPEGLGRHAANAVANQDQRLRACGLDHRSQRLRKSDRLVNLPSLGAWSGRGREDPR